MDLSTELTKALKERDSSTKLIGGENEALKVLNDFVSKKMDEYDIKRFINSFFTALDIHWIFRIYSK